MKFLRQHENFSDYTLKIDLTSYNLIIYFMPMINSKYRKIAGLLLSAYILLILSGLFHVHHFNFTSGKTSHYCAAITDDEAAVFTAKSCLIHNAASGFYNFIISTCDTCSIEKFCGISADSQNLSLLSSTKSSIRLRAPPQA